MFIFYSNINVIICVPRRLFFFFFTLVAFLYPLVSVIVRVGSRPPLQRRNSRGQRLDVDDLKKKKKKVPTTTTTKTLCWLKNYKKWPKRFHNRYYNNLKYVLNSYYCAQIRLLKTFIFRVFNGVRSYICFWIFSVNRFVR